MPSVWPSKTPERISQLVGFVARGDDLALPGAAAVEVDLDVRFGRAAMRGGQPSMTTPTPPPWDSPQVEMRKTWPKMLDMVGGEYSWIFGDC